MLRRFVSIAVGSALGLASLQGCSPAPVPSGAYSRIVPNVEFVPADGASISVLVVTVRDASGNAIPKQSIALTATGSANTFAPADGTTDATGTFVSTLASTKAEAKTVTATFGASSVSIPLTFVPGPPSAATSSLIAGSTSASADGIASLVLTVTVKDAASNLVVGQGVGMSSTGSANTFAPTTGYTNASGIFVTSMSSTSGEGKTVTATFGASVSTTVAFTGSLCEFDAQTYGVGVGLVSMAVGDFGGQGDDLAVLGFGLDGLNAGISNGDGTFSFRSIRTGPVLPPTTSPNALAVGDFAGVGHDALAFSDGSSNGNDVGVVQGLGDGGFLPPTTFNFSSGNPVQGGTQAIATGDFNGDGLTDIVVQARDTTVGTNTSVVVLLGQRDGGFVFSLAGSGMAADQIVVADLNQDGHLDLVVLSHALFTPNGGAVNVLLAGTAMAGSRDPISVVSTNPPAR